MASDHEPPDIAPVSTESGIPVAVVFEFTEPAPW